MIGFSRIGVRREVMLKIAVSLLVLLLTLPWLSGATELMFELPDRDRQCFYEEIEKGISSTLEYQVRQQNSRGHVGLF